MPNLAQLQDFWLIVLAGTLGAVIGLEREFAAKPAGLRTHTLVGAGSALMMLLGTSILTTFENDVARRLISADPIRVLQAIVVGISFLGAGTIIHDRRGEVEGLTTASSIFLTAGIGVAVAIHQSFLAIATTCFAVIVLLLVGAAERLFQRGKSLED
ncbi:MAG: MgtC/SapB family protein [Planctomycetes bacterium]|nr:MgtC/SapB family protein [Planctomycetota bacterium]